MLNRNVINICCRIYRNEVKIATINRKFYDLYNFFILGVVKRNPLFLNEIEWKNNGFIFITPNNCNFANLSIYFL